MGEKGFYAVLSSTSRNICENYCMFLCKFIR